MATENEIRLGQHYRLIDRGIQVLAAITFLAILVSLSACDGEYERLKAEADWQAKVARAAVPKKGELVTIRELGKDRYVIRKYNGGLKDTVIIARDE
jgi:hypothetical protein